MPKRGLDMLNKKTTAPRHKGVFAARALRVVLLTVTLIALIAGVIPGHNAGVAHAMAVTPSCKELVVFEGGNVNSYVKQFAGVKDAKHFLNDAGKMLSLLIQLDGLYSQIGYGPLGYVFIQTAHDAPEKCSNELLFKRLKGEDCCSRGILQDGKAALLLSGYFQERNKQMYLLTSVKFLRKGTAETVSIPSRTAGGQIDFIAKLPDTAVSFAPRKFTDQQLREVAGNYSDVMSVRDQPWDNSPSRRIGPFDIDEFSYYVVEIRPDWLKIKPLRSGLPSGWVKVPHDIGGLGLRELLPELYFMDAAALYLQTRIDGANYSPERYNRHLEKFESLMSDFEKRMQGAGDLRALGLLKSMHAILLMERSGSRISTEEMKRVSSAAAQAAELLPTSSEARLLSALTGFAKTTKPDNASFSNAASALEKELLQVLSTDPSNVYVKADLEQLWRLRSSSDKSNWQTKKLTTLRERFLKDKEILQLVK